MWHTFGQTLSGRPPFFLPLVSYGAEFSSSWQRWPTPPPIPYPIYLPSHRPQLLVWGTPRKYQWKIGRLLKYNKSGRDEDFAQASFAVMIRNKAVQVAIKVILAFVLHDRDQRRHLKISLF
jgi:hypothetical protein